MEDVRSSLPSILAGFQIEPHAPAVHFGRHRRDEAVVLSTAEYERLLAAARKLDDLERLGTLQLVRDRIDDGRFSEGTVDDLFDAADRAS